jgi:hypothetical protein
MLRLSLVAVAVLLAACATSAPPPAAVVASGGDAPLPIHGETAGKACQPSGTNQFIGQPATSETGAAIMAATHAAVLRWAPPGIMLTMDYREDRVTVRLGPDSKVTDIKCG